MRCHTSCNCFCAGSVVSAFARYLSRQCYLADQDLFDTDRYMRAVHEKQALLAESAGPRIIFVGGSSAAFGIDSPWFQQALHRRPINLGLSGHLGIDFLLNFPAEYVQPDDLIVVAPECCILAVSTSPEPRTKLEMLDCWPGATKYFPAEPPLGIKARLDKQKTFFDKQALHALGARLRRAISTVQHGPSETKMIYRRSGFNRFGDVVTNDGPSKDISWKPPLGDISIAELDRAIEKLNEFHRYCQARGARAVFTFQPYAEQQFAVSREKIDRIEARLRESLEMPILLTPEESCFPSACFFDSEHHLTRSAALMRSQSLCTALHPYTEAAAHGHTAAKRIEPKY